MKSCIDTILSIFVAPYENHLNAILDHSEQLLELLKISGVDIPSEYLSKKYNKQNLHHAHEWLIKYTQEHFFARKGERWEAEIPSWINDNAISIIRAAPNFFQTLTSKKGPKFQNPDCVCILGASRNEAERRINTTIKYLKNGLKCDNIYLLTGKRYIHGKELNHFERENLEKEYNKKDITEADMMLSMYKNKTGLEPLLINASPCNLNTRSVKSCNRNRPITEDTVEAFIDTNPTCSEVIFVSGAPNILPQQEAISSVIRKRAPNVRFEVTGEQGANLEGLSQDALAKVLYHVLMPFAGALYGSAARISKSIEQL